LFKGIRQDGEVSWVEGARRRAALAVSSFCQARDDAVVPGQPGSIDRGGVEGVAEEATQLLGEGELNGGALSPHNGGSSGAQVQPGRISRQSSGSRGLVHCGK